jgi:transposase InsO family protein
MVTHGLSERGALRLVRMSASALRYVPRLDRNAALRDRIVALAHRHRRYGAGMIYLKLRQEGRVVNHKRVDRLYAAARLQVNRRRRKKVPMVDRQPLVRPQAPNEVWSADFVFDRTAEGRVLKCLTIVDDATTEAVAVVPARALGGLPVTRILDRLALERGLPGVLRTDNGLEFCGRAMLTWVTLAA